MTHAKRLWGPPHSEHLHDQFTIALAAGAAERPAGEQFEIQEWSTSPVDRHLPTVDQTVDHLAEWLSLWADDLHPDGCAQIDTAARGAHVRYLTDQILTHVAGLVAWLEADRLVARHIWEVTESGVVWRATVPAGAA